MENVIYISGYAVSVVDINCVCYCRDNDVDCERCQHIAQTRILANPIIHPVHPIYHDWFYRG